MSQSIFEFHLNNFILFLYTLFFSFNSILSGFREKQQMLSDRTARFVCVLCCELWGNIVRTWFVWKDANKAYNVRIEMKAWNFEKPGEHRKEYRRNMWFWVFTKYCYRLYLFVLKLTIRMCVFCCCCCRRTNKCLYKWYSYLPFIAYSVRFVSFFCVCSLYPLCECVVSE